MLSAQDIEKWIIKLYDALYIIDVSNQGIFSFCSAYLFNKKKMSGHSVKLSDMTMHWYDSIAKRWLVALGNCTSLPFFHFF